MNKLLQESRELDNTEIDIDFLTVGMLEITSNAPYGGFNLNISLISLGRLLDKIDPVLLARYVDNKKSIKEHNQKRKLPERITELIKLNE